MPYFLNLRRVCSKVGCKVGPTARRSLRDTPLAEGALASKTALTLVELLTPYAQNALAYNMTENEIITYPGG